MKKIFMWVGILFFALILIGIIFGDDKKQEKTNTPNKIDTSSSTVIASNNADISTKAETTNNETELETSSLTNSQRNAIRSAEQYINMTGFSRNGLIEQLSSSAGSGYGLEDATVAVDSLNIDWNEQAARSAKQYLDMTGFSCNGLIEQLSSSAGSKYTVKQAKYGAEQAGACS